MDKFWQLFVILAFSIPVSSGAQSVKVQEEAKVSQMMDHYVMLNRQETEIKAWRIQVITTTDRRMMESTKYRFASQFPYLNTKWHFKSPYYQVKAGAFSSKIEALPELEKVKRKFKNAHLVVDRISYEELISR